MKRGRTRGPGSPGKGLASPEEASPERFRWIVDGHNAIFAVRAWEDLQVQGRYREARRGLEESLEAFGRAIGSQVWVIYDGNEMEKNPDAVARTHLRSEYSNPPEEADDRIRFLALQALRAGERPAVVTSDHRTLASTLPPGTRVVPVREFFSRVHRAALYRPEKWDPGNLSDIERHFLAHSPFEEDRRVAGSSPDGPTGGEADEDAGPEPSGR